MRVPKHACTCLLTDALQQAQLQGQAHELRSHLYQKNLSERHDRPTRTGYDHPPNPGTTLTPP